MTNLLYPKPKFKIGQVVRIKAETDPDMLAVVNGLVLTFFEHMRQHVWYVRITNSRSDYEASFDEDELEAAHAKTDDQKWIVTGGNVPIREMVICWYCHMSRISDDMDCPYCSAESTRRPGMALAAEGERSEH